MSVWEKYIRQVEPYVPGEQPAGKNLIKLNTNENPYPPSPKVEEALKNMDPEAFRKYPDPASSVLTGALARCYGVDPSQVFVGVGSDDVLAMAFMTFFNGEHPILFPDITYSFYPVWAEEFRIPYEVCPLDEMFRVVKEASYGDNGGVVFHTPNAPTGLFIGLEVV